MSSTIDERVVELRFDNKQFESGVKDSLDTLDKLNNSINKSTSSSSKAFDGINNAANKTDLSGIAKGIASLSDRFSTFGIVGMRVIENITDGLMGGLNKAVHSVTDSIVSGGVKRAMDIENAHFQLQGIVGDEKEVKAIMDDALDSVDGTAYAYNEAAKAAGVFAASGIRSGPELQKALKGIAGVAATTNQEYERISDIFTKVAGKGKIQAIELNQLASAGLGAAATMTDFFNKVNNGQVETTENVKKSVQELTGGLEITEEDLRDFVSGGEISFEIFSEAMATTFGDHAKDANQTFTGSMANIRAALARTGAMFVSPLIEQNGPFVQFFNAIRVKVNEFNKALGATNGMAKHFTDWVNKIVSSLTPMIENFKIANTYIHTWGDGTTEVMESAHKSMLKWGDGTQAVMSGDFYTPFHAFQDIVYSVVNLFKALGSVIKPVAQAFKDSFTFDSQGIYKSIEDFRKFTETLRLSEENSKNLHDAVKGVLDIFRTGIGIVSKFTQSLFHYNSGTGSLGDSFLELIGNAGRYLSTLSEMITKSETFNRVLESSGLFIRQFIDKIKEFFSNIGGTVMDKFNNDIKGSIHPLEMLKSVLSSVAELAGNVFGKLGQALSGIKNALMPIVETVKPFFALVIKSLEETIEKVGPIKAVFQLINGTLLTGIMMKLNTIFKRFARQAGKPQGVNKVLSAISKDLTELTRLIDAKALKEIAIAIGILVASMYGLAALDPDKLAYSLGAISVMLFEMIKAMQSLSDMASSDKLKDALSGVLDSVKISGLAFALIEMAAAILILSRAVKSLGSMDIEDLAKGLIAVTVLLFEMMVLVDMLSEKDGSSKMGSIGIGLILMAAGVGILTKSVKTLGTMPLEDLIKGLISVGALLLGLGVFVKAVGGAERLGEIGVGMILVAAAVKILSKAITEIGKLHIDQINKALAGMGLALFELVLTIGFISLITKDSSPITGALSLVIIALAMKSLGKTMEDLSSLSWESIGKALVAMGGAMGVFVGTLALIKKITGGSRWGNAGGVAVFGLLVALLKKPIAETLKDMASMGWESIGVGLTGMAGSMGILIGALYLLSKFDPKELAKAFAATLVIGELVLKLQPIGTTLRTIGTLGWEGVLPGLVGLAGAICILIAAMYVAGLGYKTGIPIAGALCLAVLCSQLEPVGNTLKTLGNMDWSSIGHAMVALGGALLILIAAMYLAGLFAVVSIPGAIAVAVIAQALPPLGKGLSEIGSIDWTSMGEAMKMMAKSLIILLVAAALMGIIGGVNWDTIKEAFKKLVLTLVQLGLVTKAISGINNTDWAAVYAGFKDLLKCLGLLEVIAITGGAVATTGMAGAFMLSTFGGLLLDAMDSIIQALELIKGVDPAGLEPSLNAVAMGIAKLGLSLKTFGPFANIGASAMLKLGEAIQKMTPALKILGSPDVNLDNISKGLGALAGSFKLFGQSMKSFGPFSNIGASTMLKLGEGIGAMAPGLKILGEMDKEKIKVVLTTLGEAFKSFGEALDATPFWGSKMRAGGISELINSISQLTEVLPPFMELEPGKARTALTTLGMGFQSFAEALDSTPFWGSKTRANGISTLMTNIGDLTSVLPSFMELDMGSVKTALETAGTGFTNFGTALQAAPFLNPEDRGEGIATLVESLSFLANGISLFIGKGFNGEQFEAALDLIGQAFWTFGTTINSAPLFNAEERATGITSLVESIGTLSDGIKQFMDLDADKDTIADILSIISTAMQDFGSAISEAPLFGTEDRATAITTLIDSIYDLVPAIQAFEEIGADDVKTILGAVGESLKDFGEALKASPFFGANERSEAIASLIDSLGGLTTACVELSALDQGVLTQVMGALSGGIRSFGTSLKSYDGEAEGNAQIFAGLVESVTSLAGVDAGALTSTIDAIKQFPTALTQLVSIDSNKLSSFSESMTTLAKDGLKGFIDAFSTQTQQAITGVTTFLTKVTQAMKSKSTLFAEAATKNIGQYLTTIRGKYANATTTGNTLASRVISGITSMTETFYRTGLIQGDRYLSGIKNKYAEAISVGLTLANKVLEGFARAYTGDDNPARAAGIALAQTIIDAMGNLYKKFYDIGANAGQGYVNGLKSKLEEAQRVAAQLASTAASSTAKTQQSRSPSRVFMKLGSYAGEGYVLGILDWAKDAYNAGKELAEAVDNSMEDFDATEPVIRPVVDLTNVIESAGMINSLFSDAIGMTSGLTSTASGTMNRNVLMNSAKEFQNGNNSNAGNNITFNQYNNSPKALSRIEIYRDTKNQLNQLKTAGVV